VKVKELEEVDKQQRTQIEEYTGLIHNFRDAMAQSDSLFQSYSEKLKELTTALQSARKENAALKKKTDETDVAMLKYASDNAKLTTELNTALQQKEKLESLCRALQKRTSTKPDSESTTTAWSLSSSTGFNPFAQKKDAGSNPFASFVPMCEKGLNCDDILCTKKHPNTRYSNCRVVLV